MVLQFVEHGYAPLAEEILRKMVGFSAVLFVF
jgi:hypothetical protein